MSLAAELAESRAAWSACTAVQHILLSPIAGDALGSVLVWHVDSGTVLHRFSGGDDPVDAVSWLSDDVVAAAGAATQLHLWNLADGNADTAAVQPPSCALPGSAGA